MRKKVLLALAPAFILISCGGSKTKTAQKSKSTVINGAGATFPYPVYSAWARKYYEATGIKVNYQGIGSGGGIKQVTDRVVDFGGSDEMLPPKELDKRKLYQFPAVTGAIVVVYNLKGVKDGQLKLSNRAVADIFLGKVKFWDNSEIKEDNPNLKLPHTPITVIHRAEGSGTTWNFTYWLSHISKEWADKVGYAKVVNWPVGIGAKGNAGVSNYVMQTPGAIGYVEYAYKIQNNLKAAVLQSRDGNWVKPNIESFKQAASHANWSLKKHFYLDGNLILQPGNNTWPLTVTTMILLPREKRQRNKLVTDFFNWSYKNGDEIAQKLGYVPLPKSTKELVRKYWKEVVLKR